MLTNFQVAENIPVLIEIIEASTNSYSRYLAASQLKNVLTDSW